MNKRLGTFIASLALLLSGLAFAPPAHAEEAYPPPTSWTANGRTNYGNGQLVSIGVDTRPSVPNTTVTMEARGCNGLAAASNSVTSSEPTRLVVELYHLSENFGASIPVTITYSAPGYTPASYTTSFQNDYPGSNCGGPSDGNGGTTTGIKVKKWSQKRGAKHAHIGRRVVVTRTFAPGAKVSYTWRVAGKVVDRDRVLRVKPRYQGKRVVMKVVVTKPGAKTLAKVIRYGKAHRLRSY